MGKTVGLILALQDKCSPNIKKIADTIGITEKEAKKLNTQINKLSKDLGGKLKGACVAVGAGITTVVATTGVLVSKSMEAGDRIDKMSQKIGLSRQKFQEWDYIMSQSGTDIEKMQVGMKTMSQQMVASTKRGSEAEKMFKRLGVSVKDSKGHFKSQEQAFEEIIRAFQRMPDGIEKANMAQKLFGKTGSDLRPLLNGVRGNVDELKKKFHELGMGMSDEQVDACVKLTDTMDTIKRAFSAFGNQIGADIMPNIQALADELIAHLPQIKAVLTPVIQGLTNAFKFLIEHMDGVIFIATTCLSTFMAFQAISGVIKTIQTLQSVIKAVSLAQGVWNALMIANPIGLIATGIGLLIGGIVLLVKNWDAVKNAFLGFYEKIKPALTIIGNCIKFAFSITPLGVFINGIKLLIQNWDKVTETVKKAIDAVKNFVGIKPKTKIEVKTETKDEAENKDVKVKKNAVGTAFYSGGLTRVNEFGGEIMDLPRGTRIIPNDISEKMAKNESKQDIKIEINIMGNMVGNQEFLNQLTSAFAQKLQVAMAVR